MTHLELLLTTTEQGGAGRKEKTKSTTICFQLNSLVIHDWEMFSREVAYSPSEA